MKKIIIFFTVVFLITSVYCQQRPQYTQYISNNFLINPAFAGIEKDMNITASYRKQWVGLSGSPSTSYLTFNTAFKNTGTQVSKYADEDNQQLFSLNGPHHAVGFTVINDAAGALNRFVAYGTYAYHIPLSEAINLSAGISGGISQLKVNQNKLELEMPVDAAVRNYVGNSHADINAGILFYGKQFFAGVSVQQIVQPEEETNGSSVDMYGDRKFPDLFLSGGFQFNLSENVSLTPSIMLKYINTVPLTFDINTKVEYKNLLWAGYSYRYKSGMAAIAGARIKDGIRFGYSYDISTSGLQTVSNGTHEFLIFFDIKKK